MLKSKTAPRRSTILRQLEQNKTATPGSNYSATLKKQYLPPIRLPALKTSLIT